MRRSIALLAMVSGLGGCGGSGSAEPPAVHHQDGVTYSLPAGWHVASRSLTPHLVNPREVFTAGTGRLVAQDGRCAQMPSAALAAMTPGDVLVTVQERFGSEQGFPARPQRFTLVDQRSEAETCAGPHPAFVSHWSEFRDRGRAFHVLVAVGRNASRARVSAALALLDSMRIQRGLHAARFPAAAGWRTRVSGPQGEGGCLHRQRTSWASTVPFSDGAANLPPHTMIEALPPDGVIIAAMQWSECRRPRGLRALNPPLSLRGAARMQFPGPRGDELPLYRIIGRFPDRYNVDVWVFFGRHNPTAAQRAAAQRELAGVRWPARL